MLYLVLAILFASLFSVVLKVCQQKKIDCNQVIFFNYLLGALISLIPTLIGLVSGKVDVVAVRLEGTSILCAGIQGLLFMLGFSIMDISVWRGGVALTTVSSRSSLIIPVILSWIVFDQDAPDWIGVALIFAALLLMILPSHNMPHPGVTLTSKTDEQRRRRTMLCLLGVFLVFGTSDFFLKVSQSTVQDSQLGVLTGMILLCAAVFSLIWCFLKGSFRKNTATLPAVLGGLVLGIVNTGCTSCSLRALASIQTGLFYPIYNIGIVIAGTLAGMLFFKERIKWLQIAGIALAIAAITLIFK